MDVTIVYTHNVYLIYASHPTKFYPKEENRFEVVQSHRKSRNNIPKSVRIVFFKASMIFTNWFSKGTKKNQKPRRIKGSVEKHIY